MSQDLDQFGSGEVLVEREVEVNVSFWVACKHRGHHKVGFVDGDQARHFIVGYSGLETRWSDVENLFTLTTCIVSRICLAWPKSLDAVE